MKNLLLALLLTSPLGGLSAQPAYDLAHMQTERLGRGLVAVRAAEDSVFLSWRLLRDDPADLTFDILRDGKKIASVHGNESTTYMDAATSSQHTYEVRPTKKKRPAGTCTLAADSPLGYLDIPLDKPEGGVGYTYSANDATVADLDGDGEMEIILKWDPSNSRDNSQSGLTGEVLIDAYTLAGRRLWRINLGRNIRAGAHYTQMMAYDFDGDGRGELILKTADGTVDGQGHVIGDPEADYRVSMQPKSDTAYRAIQFRGEQFHKDGRGRRGGFIASGPEYLTVFDGLTGRAIHTVDYVPPRGDVCDWGDNYANRSERYLACVAYLDGRHPSVVMCRGYYTRMTLAAFDFDGHELHQRWLFDSRKEGREYDGQGNHNLRVGDVDGDGCDEIIYGSAAIDHDGHGLYSTRMGHGDAMHLTAFTPTDPRLLVWDCHENKRDGSELHDAATGQIIFQVKDGDDVGRCLAADIDPANPGLEMWSSRSGGIRNVRGEVIDSTARLPINFALWWDGDLLRELLDHETISKWSPALHRCLPLKVLEGVRFNNGTKSNPSLCADILGDWREEVLARTDDSRHLRLYVSTLPTKHRLTCLLQDHIYRLTVATQNVAYNQPTCTGFYLGE